MSDSLSNGRAIRTLNIIDDYNREALWIEVDHSLPAERVVRVLENLLLWRTAPKQIRMDNGPEFISKRLENWAKEKRDDRGRKQQVRNRGGGQTQASPTYSGI